MEYCVADAGKMENPVFVCLEQISRKPGFLTRTSEKSSVLKLLILLNRDMNYLPFPLTEHLPVCPKCKNKGIEMEELTIYMICNAPISIRILRQ